MKETNAYCNTKKRRQTITLEAEITETCKIILYCKLSTFIVLTDTKGSNTFDLVERSLFVRPLLILSGNTISKLSSILSLIDSLCHAERKKIHYVENFGNF